MMYLRSARGLTATCASKLKSLLDPLCFGRNLRVCLTAIAVASAQAAVLTTRVGNDTLRMPSSLPEFDYTTVKAFGDLIFEDPLGVKTPPGETNRLFIIEQAGIISVITNLAAPTRTVFLDISSRVRGGSTDERGLLGMAFHPGYASNRQFYVYYSTISVNGDQLYQRLSRFRARAGQPDSADPTSEQPILTMLDEAANHNGGDVHFGPDGYLYVSLGDEGDGNDTLNNSQVIGKDFWAGIIRIDVDNRPGNLVPHAHSAIGAGTYRIPADNPFVGVTAWQGQTLNPSKVRTEFYAIGLRNPWRMSFDPVTGRLYCGDVGQEEREEVNVIVKGGNYGWAFREGLNAGPKAAPEGVIAIDPILEYTHGSGPDQGYSVIGGIVYRGQNIPALGGKYIFADYISGNVWATRYAANEPGPFFRLTVNRGTTGFGVDPANGDVLLCDGVEHTIKRLVYQRVAGSSPPATLAETGAFSDPSTLVPAPGFVPYDVNLPFWSDQAAKSRWFYVPTNAAVDFRAEQDWSFPAGSVWVKHFELELTNGVPESRRRLETRLLVKNSAGAYGVTYRWGTSTNNASVVHQDGFDEQFVIWDRSGGVLRTQVWHYPSWSECMRCHAGSAPGGSALGFNTPQLNRSFDYAGVAENQIRALHQAGYFSASSVVPPIHSLRSLARPSDDDVSLEQRVRSYLSANCSHCHAPGGAGLGSFDTRLLTPLSHAGLIDGLLSNSGGNPLSRVIAPGQPENSMMLTRLRAMGAGRMPPLGTQVLDDEAIRLFERWIVEDLPAYQTFPQWQAFHFGSALIEASSGADPDLDGGVNWQEYLAGTDPVSADSNWRLDVAQEGGSVVLSYRQVPNRGIELQWSSDPTGSSWQFLDQPFNRPFFAATNGITRVTLPAFGDRTRFFRARIYEP